MRDIFKLTREVYPEVGHELISTSLLQPVNDLYQYGVSLQLLKTVARNAATPEEFSINQAILIKLMEKKTQSAFLALMDNAITDVPIIRELLSSTALMDAINFIVRTEWIKSQKSDMLLEQVCNNSELTQALCLAAKNNIHSSVILKELFINPSLLGQLHQRYVESKSEPNFHSATVQGIIDIRRIIADYKTKGAKEKESILDEFSDKAIMLLIHHDHLAGTSEGVKQLKNQFDKLCKLNIKKNHIKGKLEDEILKSLATAGVLQSPSKVMGKPFSFHRSPPTSQTESQPPQAPSKEKPKHK